MFPPATNGLPTATAFFPLTDGNTTVLAAWPDADTEHMGATNTSSM